MAYRLFADASALRQTGGYASRTSIQDAPSASYRGLMLDVARNLQSKETVLKFIDLMSVYKMNRLHLQLDRR